MIKRLFISLFLVAPVLASGPKHDFDDPKLDDEVISIYHDMNYLRSVNVQASTGTFTYLNVSTITAISGTIGKSATNSCGYLKGSIVQVLQSSNTVSTSTTGNTYVTTNLSKAITPLCNTDLVLVSVSGTIQISNPSANEVMASLFRGSTDLYPGSGIQQGFAVLGNGGVSSQISVPAGTTNMDNPATTSATTYAVKVKCNTASVQTCLWGAEAIQYISLAEVAN